MVSPWPAQYMLSQGHFLYNRSYMSGGIRPCSTHFIVFNSSIHTHSPRVWFLDAFPTIPIHPLHSKSCRDFTFPGIRCVFTRDQTSSLTLNTNNPLFGPHVKQYSEPLQAATTIYPTLPLRSMVVEGCSGDQELHLTSQISLPEPQIQHHSEFRHLKSWGPECTDLKNQSLKTNSLLLWHSAEATNKSNSPCNCRTGRDGPVCLDSTCKSLLVITY